MKQEKLEKKVSVSEKTFGSDTDTYHEIVPWFWFPIPKPNLGLPLKGIEAGVEF